LASSHEAIIVATQCGALIQIKAIERLRARNNMNVAFSLFQIMRAMSLIGPYRARRSDAGAAARGFGLSGECS
jgi:hypothetical protein